MKKLIAHLIAVLFVSCGFALGQGLNDGLVAYYPFNGNATDESGNGNDGSGESGVLHLLATGSRQPRGDSAYCVRWKRLDRHQQ